MKKRNNKSECICGLKLKPFQFEPICTEEKEMFRRWSCSCGYVGEEHYNSDLSFIGMFNFYKPVQSETELDIDVVDFFDLEEDVPIGYDNTDYYGEDFFDLIDKEEKEKSNRLIIP